MSEDREIVDFLEDAMDAMEKAERFVADMSYEKLSEFGGSIDLFNLMFFEQFQRCKG